MTAGEARISTTDISDRLTQTDQNAIAKQRHILYTASHPVDETPKRFCL
jgi:hypothetical protein